MFRLPGALGLVALSCLIGCSSSSGIDESPKAGTAACALPDGYDLAAYARVIADDMRIVAIVERAPVAAHYRVFYGPANHVAERKLRDDDPVVSSTMRSFDFDVDGSEYDALFPSAWINNTTPSGTSRVIVGPSRESRPFENLSPSMATASVSLFCF